MVTKLNPILLNDFSASFGSNSFLSILPPQLFEELISYGHTYSLKKGEQLYKENEASDRLLFILKGFAKVTIKGVKQYEMIIKIHQSGDIVGDPFTYDEETANTVSATMMERGYVLSIEKNIIKEIFLLKQDWVYSLLKWGGLEFIKLQNKFQDFIQLDKSTALYLTLIQLANNYGKWTSEGCKIPFRVTNQDIAQMIGSARETVTREMIKLANENVICANRGSITITQISALLARVHKKSQTFHKNLGFSWLYILPS